MSLARTIIRNVVSNWVGYAVAAVTSFLLTPYVIHSLGQARYGVWMLASSLIGYYGLLDLGFRAGVNQYLTRYLAVGDTQNMNRTASTGFAALALCGSLIAVCSLLLAGLAPILFHIPQELVPEVRLVILIMAAAPRFSSRSLFTPWYSQRSSVTTSQMESELRHEF